MILKLEWLAWWCTPAIPALRRLRPEDRELQDSLGCAVRPCAKTKTNKKTF
jgi:hypothetical protein